MSRLVVQRDPSLTIVWFDLPGHGASPPRDAGARLGALASAALDAGHFLHAERPAGVVEHVLPSMPPPR